MKIRPNLLVTLATALPLLPLAAQLTPPEKTPIHSARMPALSPDGSKLAFVYRGDIWIAPTRGGRATPLTLHLGMDAYPVFSPDGKWVAFSSLRNGGWDAFAVPADGGAAQQLTYHGGTELATTWSPDGERLAFGSNRDQPRYGLYTVNVNTLKNEQFCEDYAAISHPTWSADGHKLLYVRYGFHWTRPRYHGSAAAQIWLYDTQSKTRREVTRNQHQHLWPKFLPDSEHFITVTVGETTPSTSTLETVIPEIDDNPMRTPNLWKFDLDGKGEALTSFTGGAVRCPTVSANSGDVAFEYETDLWLLRAGKKKPGKIKLYAAIDSKETKVKRETLTSGVPESEPSPDGKTVAFSLRGDIWTIPVTKPPGVSGRNAGYAMRLTDWVGEDSDFSWSKDGKKLYFTSDRHKNTRVFELDVATQKVTPIWNRMEDVTGLRISPDGKHLVFWVSGPEGGLWLWTLETGEARRIAKVPGTHWRGNGGGSYSWSPDLKWIAYTFRGESQAWNIWVVPSKGGSPINVTRLYAHHSQPTWSPDGKYLFFHSNRDGDGLYVLPLTPESIRNEDTDITFSKPSDDVEVKIDFDDISQRIRKLASQTPQGDLQITPNGRILFLSQGDVWSLSYDGKEARRLTSGGGKTQLRSRSGGNRLFFIQKGELYTSNGDGKGIQKISFTAEWERDVRAEREAAFAQFWRSYHRGFYDPNFHGRNWGAIGERYRPRLESVERPYEFATLLQMMIGELETSHSEVKPTSNGFSTPVTPHVGFTFDYSHQGPGIKVGRIASGTPAAYEKTRIRPGEYVMKINDEPVSASEGLYREINGKQNREFEFLVNDKPDIKGARTVKYQVLSQSAWKDLNYKNRVADNQKLVTDKTKGKIGYIHISAMGSHNQRRFEREIYEYMIGKEGMIIDVRFNTGGNIADTLVDWLERKPHGYIRPRDGQPIYSPQRAWVKPVVVVMNEHSYSNAEIFSYAMRTRGLARLVGQPTPGYVIWTDSLRLVDGTGARMPQSGFYRLDGTTQENDGEEPDYFVELTPDDWLGGSDPQLGKAIELLLSETPSDAIVDKGNEHVLKIRRATAGSP